MDWYTETFGECPHGGIKPYCAECVGDTLEAEREQRRERQTTARLRERVSPQSGVIAEQDALIDALKRRLARR